MDTPCPATIQEFLPFLPARPWLDSEVYPTSIDVYTAQDVAPAADRPIYCRPDLTLIPRLMQFLVGLVNTLDIGGVSCQAMQQDLEAMSNVSFQSEVDVSRYSGHVAFAIQPIVRAIAEAAGLPGRFSVEQRSVSEVQGDFDITVVRRWFEGGHIRREPVVVCSEEDRAYSVLLSKVEELSRPISLDVTKKQIGANALAVELALQMAVAKAEYGFFFAGYIAIAAQLVRSTDTSRPGRILLLSPVFKLQNETLPYPNPLTHFQAKIPTEPFLAILVAMLCANILSGHTVESPPDLLLEILPNEDNEEGGSDSEEYIDASDEAGQSGIASLSLQVTTNAMILQHPCLRSSDIHRIYVDQDTLLGGESVPTPSSEDSISRQSLQQQSFMHLCRRAPHIPSTNVDTVTLVERIRVSRWSNVWRCCVNNEEKLRIVKFVSEVHSSMVLRELYMYEVALKDCSLVPVCYGVFHRPVGGWFGFLLEDVGDSLEEIYGTEWSDVKRGMSATQWENLINSVEKLHSLSVRHGDLEPRNMAQTAEGFKFFDFGRSRLHHCQRDECGELEDMLDVYT